MANLSNINNKFLVTTGGNVGIGVTGPTAKLDIGGMADPVLRIKSDAGGDPQLIFDAAQANRSARIKFYDNGSSVGGFIDYLHNGDKMNFGAGSSTGVTMTVADGTVGIGTTAPTAKLDISGMGTGGVGVRIKDAQNVAGSYYYGFMFDGTDIRGTTQSNIFYAGGSVLAGTTIATWASLRISTPYLNTGAAVTNNYAIYQESTSQKSYFAGNVGIGTTTPNTALQVNQSTTVPLLVHRPSNASFDPHGIGFSTRTDALNGGLGDVRSGIFSDYNGDLFLAAAQSSITTSPLSSSRLFIEGSNGNVGIGTISPGEKLQVQLGDIKIDGGANSNERGLIIAHGGLTGNQTRLVQDSSASIGHLYTTERGLRIQAGKDGSATGGNLDFYTNQVARYRITTGGGHQWTTDGSFGTAFSYTFRDAVGINNPNSVSAQAVAGYVLSVGRSSSGRCFRRDKIRR